MTPFFGAPLPWRLLYAAIGGACVAWGRAGAYIKQWPGLIIWDTLLLSRADP